MSKFPKRVETLKNVSAVSCGKLHTLAVTEDGKVYSCGKGRSAALGHGDRDSRETFDQILSLKGHRITQVQAGEDFSLFLSDNGHVFACGASDFGQTGLGQEERYFLKPKQILGFNNKKAKLLSKI